MKKIIRSLAVLLSFVLIGFLFNYFMAPYVIVETEKTELFKKFVIILFAVGGLLANGGLFILDRNLQRAKIRNCYMTNKELQALLNIVRHDEWVRSNQDVVDAIGELVETLKLDQGLTDILEDR